MREDCYDPANETPERALREVYEACRAVYKAFGAPGNYGYGHPEGESLQYLYVAADLVGRTLKKLPTQPEESSPLRELAENVQKMREAQTAYFRGDRSSMSLKRSKVLERRVDQLAAEILAPPSLFDREEVAGG